MGTRLQIMACNPLEAACRLLSQYEPIGIDEAYVLCKILECEDEDFIWQGKRATLKTLVAHYSSLVHTHAIKIRFVGGPLGWGAWYNGTIWTFLLDHIANSILTDGYLMVQTKLKKYLTLKRDMV
jgi:hypothetical protein